MARAMPGSPVTREDAYDLARACANSSNERTQVLRSKQWASAFTWQYENTPRLGVDWEVIATINPTKEGATDDDGKPSQR